MTKGRLAKHLAAPRPRRRRRPQLRVAVVGSINVDWIVQVDRLPDAGETVLAGALLERFGGKGANQAIAAARQGAQVSLIGCVGDDDMGRRYREHLRHEGIDDAGVRETRRAPTGVALIAVERQHGENTIIVAPGANGTLSAADVRAHADRIAAARAVLAQWEVPQAAVLEALRLAHRAGVPAIVNPSPMRDDFPWRRVAIHTLIVNEDEARALFGGKASTRGARAWKQAFDAHGLERLIITRGAGSTLVLMRERGVDRVTTMEVETMTVRPVDTVGAGDAFAGTYAAAIAAGRALRDAVRYANVAGALATLAPGAQESAPSLRAVTRALRGSMR